MISLTVAAKVDGGLLSGAAEEFKTLMGKRPTNAWMVAYAVSVGLRSMAIDVDRTWEIRPADLKVDKVGRGTYEIGLAPEAMSLMVEWGAWIEAGLAHHPGGSCVTLEDGVRSAISKGLYLFKHLLDGAMGDATSNYFGCSFEGPQQLAHVRLSSMVAKQKRSSRRAA